MLVATAIAVGIAITVYAFSIPALFALQSQVEEPAPKPKPTLQREPDGVCYLGEGSCDFQFTLEEPVAHSIRPDSPDWLTKIYEMDIVKAFVTRFPGYQVSIEPINEDSRTGPAFEGQGAQSKVSYTYRYEHPHEEGQMFFTRIIILSLFLDDEHEVIRKDMVCGGSAGGSAVFENIGNPSIEQVTTYCNPT